jgi:hypothetical protein
MLGFPHQRHEREVRKIQDGRPQATAEIAPSRPENFGGDLQKDVKGYEPLRAAVIAGAGWFYGEMTKMYEGRGLIESSKDFRNDVEQEVQKLFS